MSRVDKFSVGAYPERGNLRTQQCDICGGLSRGPTTADRYGEVISERNVSIICNLEDRVGIHKTS